MIIGAWAAYWKQISVFRILLEERASSWHFVSSAAPRSCLWNLSLSSGGESGACRPDTEAPYLRSTRILSASCVLGRCLGSHKEVSQQSSLDSLGWTAYHLNLERRESVKEICSDLFELSSVPFSWLYSAISLLSSFQMNKPTLTRTQDILM